MRKQLIGMVAVALIMNSALATETPQMPKKWHPLASEESINESAELSKRLVDTPIVRSSKGCIGFLGETKSGTIIVRHLLDKNGKPICRPEYAYGFGTTNKLK